MEALAGLFTYIAFTYTCVRKFLIAFPDGHRKNRLSEREMRQPVAAKDTEDAEKAARAAQEAQVAKAANLPKVTSGPAKASTGKAATPVQQFQVDHSLSPENDDFQ